MSKQEEQDALKFMINFLADNGQKVHVVLDDNGDIEQVEDEFVVYDEDEQSSLDNFK